MSISRYLYPFKTLGFIGGGQLGKMMALEAKRMGFRIIALDPSPDCPISTLCDELIVGSLYDEQALIKLVEKSDVVTYEIEHTKTEFLKELYDKGYNIQPSPYVLEIINNKLRQKKYLISNKFPTPKIHELDLTHYNDKQKRIEAIERHNITFPFVQKAKRGGYDGRGVFVLKSEDDLDKIIYSESYIEEYVDISKEISILLARDKNDNIKVYEPVEMLFSESGNILDMLISPARISNNLAKIAKEIAVEVVRSLNGVGIFAVEMFVTSNEEILINEIAPRVHNSGHHTIEACYTSQFEQHIRAICDLPLGSTYQHTPAVMINLLGEEGYSGRPVVENLEDVFCTDGAYFHFYGKSFTSPRRKMGHITILDKDIEKAIQKAIYLKSRIRVISK
ncbi:MAG: 5-(carboxyamino)imidazole ribonucleotide synthase [Fervidobacterium sp.]